MFSFSAGSRNGRGSASLHYRNRLQAFRSPGGSVGHLLLFSVFIGIIVLLCKFFDFLTFISLQGFMGSFVLRCGVVLTVPKLICSLIGPFLRFVLPVFLPLLCLFGVAVCTAFCLLGEMVCAASARRSALSLCRSASDALFRWLCL